jgi:hypothetical protein
MQAFAGAGALRSTVADLLRFSRAVLAGRNGPLGPAAERLLTPLGRIDTGEIGYGVWIRGPKERRSYFHEGWTSGYRSVWMVLPETREAFVMLTSNGQAQPWRVRNAIAAGHYPVTPVTPVSVALPASALAPYAGVYRASSGSSTFTFVLQEGTLYRRITGVAFQPLTPAGVDLLVDQNLGVTYQFTRDNGRPVSALFTQGGGAQTLVRTDAPTPDAARLPDEVVAAFAGQFVERRLLKANRVFDVQARDGQLAVKLNNQIRYPVFPVPGQRDRFAYDVVKAELQFERDATGQVVALVLHQNGEFRAQRTGR